MSGEMTVSLTSEEAALLSRPGEGEGGFQSFLRSVQERIEGNTVTLSRSDIEKVVRYSTQYGEGGFQDRIVALLRAIVRATTGLEGS